MVDYFSFINSTDIRKHLKKLDYHFSGLEAAWIVYQSEVKTLKQKYKAWKQIIEDYEDVDIPARNWCLYEGTLHTYLKLYMELLDRWKKEFETKTLGDVYSVRYFFGNESDYTHDNTNFESISKCWKYIDELSEDLGEKPHGLRIRKTYLNKKDTYITVNYNDKHEMMDIDFRGFPFSEEDNNILLTFSGMFFQFPVPFKKGDVLIRYQSKKVPKEYETSPMVMSDCIACRELSDYEKNNADESDMVAWGYFQALDGGIYHENTCYMDMEFYRGDFEGNRRILLALSQFYKGTIDISMLMEIYRHVCLEASFDAYEYRLWQDICASEKRKK